MTYNTSNVFKVTRKQVLDLTTEYDVFCQYMGFKPIVGNLYTSPLRKDFNASFGLFYATNGHLLFKDFGTGESGNCFKFASLMDKTSIEQIYKDLYRQYSSKKIKKTPKAEIPQRKLDSIEIVVEKTPFTKAGLEFWTSFGITESTLNHFNVSQAKKVWSNGRLYGYGTEKNPIFNYEVFDKNKIYRPYNKDRFYSNCTSFDIQGWEQLDYSKDTVIITKSLKDLMLLHELGYTAVAPNGEGHNIPEKAIKELRKNFDNVIIWYDKDPGGIKGVRKLLKQYPDFGFAFTPTKQQKDITDYYKEHGRKETISLISKRINHAKEKHFQKRA